MPLDVTQPGSSRNTNAKIHPLDQLEEDLAMWCAQHGRSGDIF